MTLSAREQAFVQQYLICRVGTQAAIKAGYAEKSAKVTASKLLTKANLAAAIAEGEKQAAKRAEVTLDDVVAELARVAFSGMSKFIRISPDGDPIIDLSNCTEADLDLLAETTIEEFAKGWGEDARDVRRIKIKPLDRFDALKKFDAHLGIGNNTVDAAQKGLIGPPWKFSARVVAPRRSVPT